MFCKLSNEINCEVCGGDIEFSFSDTSSDYTTLMRVNLVDIFDTVENIMMKHLVYRCGKCGQIYRYTYKDIENKVRKKLTEAALSLIVSKQLPDVSYITNDKYFIYCGKCNGIDGSGCCPKSVFNTCDIKRFPFYDI